MFTRLAKENKNRQYYNQKRSQTGSHGLTYTGKQILPLLLLPFLPPPPPPPRLK